jgi:putative colanic acid biosynthesis acetyltransferase WcaF
MIWAPWNLEVGQRTAIGPKANCYNPGKIILGNKVILSQNSHLCAASHDYTKRENPLIIKPIIVGDYAWVAADAFVGFGVNIGDGAVVGARACVFKDVEPWTVVGGNPAKLIKKRYLID